MNKIPHIIIGFALSCFLPICALAQAKNNPAKYAASMPDALIAMERCVSIADAYWNEQIDESSYEVDSDGNTLLPKIIRIDFRCAWLDFEYCYWKGLVDFNSIHHRFSSEQLYQAINLRLVTGYGNIPIDDDFYAAIIGPSYKPAIIEDATVIEEIPEEEYLASMSEEQLKEWQAFVDSINVYDFEEPEPYIPPVGYYDEASSKPTFLGNSAISFSDWISNKLSSAKVSINKECVPIYLSIVIDRDGTITDVTVIDEKENTLLKKRAIQIAKSSPKWEPGIYDRWDGAYPTSFSLVVYAR